MRRQLPIVLSHQILKKKTISDVPMYVISDVPESALYSPSSPSL